MPPSRTRHADVDMTRVNVPSCFMCAYYKLECRVCLPKEGVRRQIDSCFNCYQRKFRCDIGERGNTDNHSAITEDV